jgi:hypothetical protein
MYFATDENGLVISHGDEEYPGSHFIQESDLPQFWHSVFVLCKLGYKDGQFFEFIPVEESIGSGVELKDPETPNG